MICALWAALASSAALYLLIKGRTPQEQESPAQRNSEADPAKLMREWFYGGDAE